MTGIALALAVLTALALLVGAILIFGTRRLAHAARPERDRRQSAAGTDLVASALQEAVQKIRDQERAMQARAEASERLSAEIISSLTSGLLVVQVDGTVRLVNPAGRRLLHLDPERTAGTFRHVLKTVPALADLIEQCLTTRQPIARRTLELPPPRPSDGASHLGVTVSPLAGEEGSLHGAICLYTDLSEIVDLEEQLRIKESLAKLGEMTAGIAHEFRNGLATIHGYSRLVDLSRLPEQYQAYIRGIRQETESLGQVVTNFLNFARPAELTLTTVDLRAVVERAKEEIGRDVEERGGEVRIEGDFATVQGDEVLLRQAFSNLCRNAVEACGGAAAGSAPRIVIDGALDPAQGVVRVGVNDNGPGFDPTVKDRLFRPFVTTKPDGTGLGLALVQKIVVTHNGRLAAGTSALGGARVQVTLPVSPGR